MADNHQQMLILVDENDQAIGTSSKHQAHLSGLLHRAFSICLFRKRDQHLETLIQQRHPDKYHFGSLWSNSCCSHPSPGETIAEAANRRLKEELNIETTLYPTRYFQYYAQHDGGMIEHEIDHVLFGFYDQERIAFHPDEISATQWVKVEQLQQSILDTPSVYSPWLEEALTIALGGVQAMIATDSTTRTDL